MTETSKKAFQFRRLLMLEDQANSFYQHQDWRNASVVYRSLLGYLTSQLQQEESDFLESTKKTGKKQLSGTISDNAMILGKYMANPHNSPQNILIHSMLFHLSDLHHSIFYSRRSKRERTLTGGSEKAAGNPKEISSSDECLPRPPARNW
eukprot:TRINITY_DN32414_c0_g1_i1.p1 TRINITY_DN32414_c0_g1~~TRINITY_DN32414_c0_g1_i1.p1  ORF type:complete len:150 (+),score=5.69 TRINITY_DN32414_c0_g1_i1:59-508(+)